jgi:ATP-dependent HslUV protease ATP-binding subunit HslU
MESTGRAIAIGPMGLDVTQLLEGVKPRAKKQKVSVAEGRPIIEQTEIDRLLSTELIQKKAIKAVEQNGIFLFLHSFFRLSTTLFLLIIASFSLSSGIVFLDEVDKICSPADAPPTRSDASAEGVQKDLLPMLEGTIINTRYGDVDTSKILWIASGAFQSVRPSDLMAEFQGRLPIRVELKPLTRDDLFRILTEPENNLLEQQRALLRTENIDLRFTEGAVREIARIASEVNASVQDIGARRLHTIIERVMEEINFECDKYVGTQVTVNEEHVRKQVGEMLVKNDISRYIL